MSVPKEYIELKKGLAPDETHLGFIERAKGVIAGYSASELTTQLSFEVSETIIRPELEESLEIYLKPIVDMGTGGMLGNLFLDGTKPNILWSFVMKEPSNLSKVELPRLATRLGAETELPPQDHLSNTPLSYVERLTLDTIGIVENKGVPSLEVEMIEGAALDKMTGYERPYIQSALGIIHRTVDSDGMGIRLGPKGDRILKTAIIHANMLWQMRHVVRYLRDAAQGSNKNRLQDIQFAPFNQMVADTFESKKHLGYQYAKAYTTFTVLQDVHECVE